MSAVRAAARCLLMISAGILVSGCATTRNEGRGEREVLTAEQISGVQGARNLYDVVQRLRPRWLNTRAEFRSITGERAQILVYQDKSRLGGVDMLRQLSPSAARELHYLDGPTAAGTLPGIGMATHVAGAIIVVTGTRED